MTAPDEKARRELNPADLRGILKYVPQWRNHVFVLAVDGSVFSSEMMSNLMLEIAVLHNLNIRLVIVFGIGHQIQRIAHERGISVSDHRGLGPTDHPTLEVASEASGRVGHLLEQGLTQHHLKAARINAVRATERGILGGRDQLYTGKVEKIDGAVIRHLLEREIIPLLSPLAFSRDGQAFRLNSDHLAMEMAKALKASKLIFLLPHPGLTLKGVFQLNVDVREIKKQMEEDPEAIDEEVRSKANYAIRTIEAGTPRAHIIDSRIEDGLLLEIFSKVGIGSMIHSNPYSRIRPAKRKDAVAIHTITKSAVREESLRPRSRQSIEQAIGDYFVYEVDESVIGCFRLTAYSGSRTVELGSVFVHPAYKGRQIGRVLVEFAINEARGRKRRRVVALTTQTSRFFKESCGFEEGDLTDLPKALRDQAKASGRQSKVLKYNLS